MKTLGSRLRSALAAAGPVLCLAACGQPAPRPARDGAPPPPASAPASSGTGVPRAVGFLPPAPSRPASATTGRPPKQDLAALAALAETDPRAALLAAERADLGAASFYIRGTLLQRWAEQDFAAALAHADLQPPGPAREEMFGRLALILARSLPREAAALVAHDMAPGEIRAEAAISVVHRWAREDPGSAAAWAAAFPPGPLRERALAEAADTARATAPDR